MATVIAVICFENLAVFVTQNNLERSDYENNVRLGHQLDRLDKENTILRQKLDEKDEQLRSTQNDLEVCSLIVIPCVS